MFKLSVYWAKSTNEYGCLFEWENDTARIFVSDIMELIIILKHLGIENMSNINLNSSNITLEVQRMILELISALT